MFALVRDDTIAQVGALPRLYHDGTRWWDLRPGQHAPEDAGWYEVQETPRPADTNTHTYESSIELIDGTPTRVWAEREWTEPELLGRAEALARLDSVEERVAILWAAVFPPDPKPTDPAPEDFPEFSGMWHPDTIIRDGGRLWRNTTTVPLTSAPSEFPGAPGQWTHLFVEVATAPTTPDYPAWDADATYAVGDRVTDEGVVYECLIAHGPERQGTWRPGPATPTVWRVIA